MSADPIGAATRLYRLEHLREQEAILEDRLTVFESDVANCRALLLEVREEIRAILDGS